MDNLRQQSAVSKFLQEILKGDVQLGFDDYLCVPAVLLRNYQEWQLRPDKDDFHWFVGQGYQLWDSTAPKDIFVLAKDEDEAQDKFYCHMEGEIEHVNELPNGNYTEYDAEMTDDGEMVLAIFEYHSEFEPTIFDFAQGIWDKVTGDENGSTFIE